MKIKITNKKMNIISLSLIPILVIILILPSVFKKPDVGNRFVDNRTFESYSDLFFDYEMIRYPSSGEIGSSDIEDEKINLGIVIDPWNLNFGIIPKGSFERRYIDLENLKSDDAKISFDVHGNTSSLVSFSKEYFILQKEEKARVDVYFRTENEEIGNYTGEIDVIIKRPKYNFLYSILGWSE